MYAVFQNIRIAIGCTPASKNLAAAVAQIHTIKQGFKEPPFYSNRKAEQRRNQLAKQALKNSRK